MKNKDILTKILAVAGTLLVWLPVAAPVFFSAAGFFSRSRFNFDYLMPAELFPLVMVGSGLLLVAALLSRRRRGLIGWGLVSAVLLPVIGSVIAKLTGLADGRIEPGGWQWALVLGFLVSVFELACTGQVYFPTLVYLVRIRPDAGSFFYLLLYNLGFILPLGAVFLLAYLGVGSQRLAGFARRSLAAAQLALAVLFLGLAVLTYFT